MFGIERFIKKMIGKPTCVLGKSSRLLKTAKILNAGKSSLQIKIGSNTAVGGELFVFAHGGQINIGDWCYIGPETRIWSAERVIIGNRVLISHQVNVMDSLTHPLGPWSRHQQFVEIFEKGHPLQVELSAKPVIIEDDCWIGAGAIILRGVLIGSGAIVGAGSVVTKNVPPYSLVAGNPAQVIRELTSEERAS